MTAEEEEKVEGDGEAMLNVEACIRFCSEVKAENEYKEDLRISLEPDPLQFGIDYAEAVQEMKRLCVEYDEVEKGEHVTQEREDKLDADARRVGQFLHDMGGVDWMRFTIETYVPRSLHSSFDWGFDGVGEWKA